MFKRSPCTAGPPCTAGAPRHLLIVSLLSARTVVHGYGMNGNGSAACRCLTEVPNDALPDYASAGYGLGCAKHDVSEHVHDHVKCRARYPGDRVPAWCEDAWCFVGPGCALQFDIVDRVAALRYSFATCGHIDRFQSFLLEERFANSTIKVAYLSNSGGWKGSFCSANETCHGAVFDFLKETLDDMAGSVGVSFTNVQGEAEEVFMEKFPKEMSPVFLDNHRNETVSRCTACAYAAAMGHVDLCISACSITPSRTQIADFVQLFSEPVYLVAKSKEDDASFKDLIFNFAVPFRSELWLALALTQVCLALAFRYVEHGEVDHSVEKTGSTLLQHGEEATSACSESPVRAQTKRSQKQTSRLLDRAKTTDAVFESFGLVFHGAGFNPKSSAGKMVALAAGFLVLISTANYTANLSSYFVMKKSFTLQVERIDDVRRAGAKVCVRSVLREVLFQRTRLPYSYMVSVKSREDLIPGVLAGDCLAAVVKEEDFLKAQSEAGSSCQIRHVGTPLFYVDVGLPVSTKFQKAFRHMFTQRKAQGAWEQALERHEPASLCAARDEVEGEDLSLSSFCGVFLFTGIIVLVSCSMKAFKNLREGRQEQQRLAPPGSPSAALSEVGSIVGSPRIDIGIEVQADEDRRARARSESSGGFEDDIVPKAETKGRPIRGQSGPYLSKASE